MDTQIQMQSTGIEIDTCTRTAWEAPELKVSSVAQETLAGVASSADGGGFS
jgi:hypothetical protein